MTNRLIYQNSPEVTLASNKFIDVPVILQHDETPLISVVRGENLTYSTEIPIFHADGTYLAKVNGTRVFKTAAGEKAGIVLRDLPQITVCELDGRTIFEIRHERGDAFRTTAELYSANGYFVKCPENSLPQLLSQSGQVLQLNGMHMSFCEFRGCRIGIRLCSDGSMQLGVG